MKLLYKYIISELNGPFWVGLSFFTFIFILSPILRLVDLLIVKRAPFIDVSLLFIYLLPCTVAIVIPMATLVAILMAYGRLSSDSEVIAMRASGISYFRIFLPAIIFSIIMSLVGIFFNDTLLPRGNFAFQKLYKDIVQRKPLTELNEHILTDIGDYKVIGVDRLDKKRNIMHGVVVFEQEKNTGGMRIITARTGKWLETIEKKVSDTTSYLIMRLLLENGYVQEPAKDNIDDFSNIPFGKLIVNIVEEINYSITVYKGAREKTTSEILADIREKEKESHERAHKLWVEYHKRFSIPFAALAFVLIGLPFSIVSGRSGKSVSMGISIAIIFVYYLFYAFGEGAGKNGKLPEALALWVPNLIFFLAGSYYIYRISKT